MKKKTQVSSPKPPVRAASNPSGTNPSSGRTAATAVPEISSGATDSPNSRWTFLTNHSHVLILISRNPDVVLRHVALQVGITERAVQRIIADLEEAGILEREKVGRQNHYRILADRPLRHAIESHRKIGDLLTLMDLPTQ